MACIETYREVLTTHLRAVLTVQYFAHWVAQLAPLVLTLPAAPAAAAVVAAASMLRASPAVPSSCPLQAPPCSIK